MNRYSKILVVLLVLSANTFVVFAKNVEDKDGVPQDDSWTTKESPIITKENNISKAEFILKEEDLKEKKQTKNIINPAFGSSGTCWSTFASWKSYIPVKYVINPKNPQGLSQSFITSAIYKSAETWDAVTPKELFYNTYKIDNYAKYGIYDGKNDVVFRYLDPTKYPGVIAATGIWYYTDSGQIIETDMLFNTVYKWGDATINPSRMDLRDIATHEFGHVVGMNDIYSSTCSSVTMYGYAKTGETKKRTLETPDKTGLLSLY